MIRVEDVRKRFPGAASATLDHTREYFPGEYDQRCARMAEIKRADLGL